MGAGSASVAVATQTLNEAVAVFDAGASDPGPAAGPRAAIAVPSLKTASSQFEQTIKALPPDEPLAPMIVMQLALLRDGCTQQANNLIGAAFVPWPFVYAALGPIGGNLNGLVIVAKNVSALLAALPDALDAARAAAPLISQVPINIGKLHAQFATGLISSNAGAPATGGPPSPSKV